MQLGSGAFGPGRRSPLIVEPVTAGSARWRWPSASPVPVGWRTWWSWTSSSPSTAWPEPSLPSSARRSLLCSRPRAGAFLVAALVAFLARLATVLVALVAFLVAFLAGAFLLSCGPSWWRLHLPGRRLLRRLLGREPSVAGAFLPQPFLAGAFLAAAFFLRCHLVPPRSGCSCGVDLPAHAAALPPRLRRSLGRARSMPRRGVSNAWTTNERISPTAKHLTGLRGGGSPMRLATADST